MAYTLSQKIMPDKKSALFKTDLKRIKVFDFLYK